MLLNANVGQGLFFAGLKHVAIQIIASYNEDKIITTNPEEILAQREISEGKFKKKEEVAETETVAETPPPPPPVTDAESTESAEEAPPEIPPEPAF